MNDEELDDEMNDPSVRIVMRILKMQGRKF